MNGSIGTPIKEGNEEDSIREIRTIGWCILKYGLPIVSSLKKGNKNTLKICET